MEVVSTEEIILNETNLLCLELAYFLKKKGIEDTIIYNAIKKMTSFEEKEDYINFIEKLLLKNEIDKTTLKEIKQLFAWNLKKFRWKFEAFKMYNINLVV